MEPLLVLLVVINLVLTVALLIVMLVRARPQAGSDASSAVRSELQQQLAVVRGDLQGQRTELTQMLSAANEARAVEVARERDARALALREMNEVLGKSLTDLRQTLEQRLQTLTDNNSTKQIELQKTLTEELDKLRQGNEAKLEKMRETVDEKLQGTLEKRLGESFSLVSERLEQVQKGLGEMQTLASDVGGLKRVLTNVKNRGGWGEVQLARQLEDMLTHEQYAENVQIRPGSAERVEFAIKLPGRDDDQPVWLPIDSKFPQEDYERLLEAQERGEKAEIDTQVKNLERVILAQAKLISEKYIEPPYSTDFGIMYLPTEGLFAEVVRNPGLVSRLQHDFHITVAGPSVLMTLLNSLQMGFRTLAIEQRSSEVWKVLSAAKTEFQKYGQVWDKLGKQLQTAQNTVSEAGRRTRAVEKRLRDVETMEVGVAEIDPLDLGAEIERELEFNEADLGSGDSSDR